MASFPLAGLGALGILAAISKSQSKSLREARKAVEKAEGIAELVWYAARQAERNPLTGDKLSRLEAKAVRQKIANSEQCLVMSKRIGQATASTNRLAKDLRQNRGNTPQDTVHLAKEQEELINRVFTVNGFAAVACEAEAAGRKLPSPTKAFASGIGEKIASAKRRAAAMTRPSQEGRPRSGAPRRGPERAPVARERVEVYLSPAKRRDPDDFVQLRPKGAGIFRTRRRKKRAGET